MVNSLQMACVQLSQGAWAQASAKWLSGVRAGGDGLRDLLRPVLVRLWQLTAVLHGLCYGFGYRKIHRAVPAFF